MKAEQKAMVKNCRLLFLMSRFLDGGIDTVLIDYLKRLSQNNCYHITLAIALDMGPLEVFSNQIPPNIVTTHLVEKEWLVKWRRKKITQRLPLLTKIYDEVLLNPIRRYLIGRKIKSLASMSDVVIDFDCCAYSYLRTVEKKKIAWFHFSFEQSLKQNRKRTMRIGRQLEAYDKIVTISKAMCSEGRNLFPRLSEKLCVIYNAKDREQLLTRACEATDNRVEHPYIISVERLEESQKDLTTLIKAYKLLKQEYHHEEQLFLLGKGKSETTLRQLAKKLGIEDDVVFLGFKDNPYPWMKHASLLVHSAKLEGLPTVLIEGLMLDTLIVATDCPTGPKEILDMGRAGLLVPVGNEQIMAKAMHRMLTDKQLQFETLQHARQHRKHFMSEETQQLFDEMIDDLCHK